MNFFRDNRATSSRFGLLLLIAVVFSATHFVQAQKPDATLEAKPDSTTKTDTDTKTNVSTSSETSTKKDLVRNLQTEASESELPSFGHWGPNPNKYSSWTSHSNRLIPIYTFGMTLESVNGKNSIYRDEEKIKKLYGRVPEGTANPDAEYFDQTDVFRLQEKAAAMGKKKIILMIYDGMDWQTTWAAATYNAGKLKYKEGRGTGLHFQDYRGTTTDFGYFVTSPYMMGNAISCDKQKVILKNKERFGGYNFETAGLWPWSVPADVNYPIGKGELCKQPYTDSSSSATSMNTGIKTYNEAVNVTHDGKHADTIAHILQRQGFAIGVVTSVPVSHATPACAYSHNVSRDDYQDLSRDLLGLPSISHGGKDCTLAECNVPPLPGVDVLIGCGWGEIAKADGNQGKNFVPGNQYITDEDMKTIDVANGGKYTIAQRTPGKVGSEVIAAGADQAIANKTRFLGYFGAKKGHLPFRTADGDYNPTVNGRRRDGSAAENYTEEEVKENPILADFATQALRVLNARSDKFWMMIEAGDVDWANHANNIDNSIGAVISGDMAFKAICDWVEKEKAWDDTAIIVTADHGHYLVLTRPDMLVGK